MDPDSCSALFPHEYLSECFVDFHVFCVACSMYSDTPYEYKNIFSSTHGTWDVGRVPNHYTSIGFIYFIFKQEAQVKIT
jgi:hypothetical protein